MKPSPPARLTAAVAAYFVVSAAANLLMVLLFGDLYRRYFTLRYQGRVGSTPLGDSVDGAMALLLAVTVATAVVFVGLAALTALRPRPWLALVDAVVLLVAGGPTVVGRLVEIVSPTNTPLPPVFGQTQLVLSVLAVGLGVALALGYRTGRRTPPAAEPA